MTGMMITAFQIGFVYSLLPGPILFASSQRVVTRGLREGCWFILGVTLADLIYIALIHWGLSGFLTENRLMSIGLWMLGGGWLIKLGVDAIRVPVHARSSGKQLRIQPGSGRTLVDGLFINLFNPLTLLGWIALGANFIATINPQDTMTYNNLLLILLAILAGILTWQVFIIVFSGIIRQQMHEGVLKWLSLGGGVCLIAYGMSAWVSAAGLIA